MKTRGFTLIEILIALLIFVMISVATTTTLYLVFSSRDKVAIAAARMAEIQMALTIIERDIDQFINRPVRTKELHYSPSIYGKQQQLTFTRGGVMKTYQGFNYSSLQRLSYVYKNNTLYRRSWRHLDGNRQNPDHTRVILQDIESLSFAYLDDKLNILNELNNDSLSYKQQINRQALIPKAIQLNLSLRHWGKASFLFIIPEGNYGERA